METGLPIIVILVFLSLLIVAFLVKKFQFALASISALFAAVIMFAVCNNSISDQSNSVDHVELYKELDNYKDRIAALNKENTQLSKRVEEEEENAIAKLKLQSDIDSELKKTPLIEEPKGLPSTFGPFSKTNENMEKGNSSLSRLFDSFKSDVEEQDVTWEFKEYNCKLSMKNSEVRKIAVELVNPEAIASWRFKKSAGFGVLIVENITGLGVTREELDEAVLENLKENTDAYKIVKREEMKTEAGTFLIRHCETILERRSFYFIVATMNHNGYYYQVTNWSLNRNRKKADFVRDSMASIKNLTLIDPSKVAPNINIVLAKSFTDKNFGIEITNPDDWEYYNLEQDKDTLPAYGFNIKGEGVLVYNIYAPASVSDKKIFEAYNEEFNLSEAVPFDRVKTRTVNGHEIKSIVIDFETEGGSCHSKFELVRNGDRRCMLRTWAWKKDKLIDADIVWKNLEWLKPEAKEIPKHFKASVRMSSSKVLNQLGLIEFGNSSYLKAFNNFEYARLLDPSNETYVRNMIQCHLEMGQNQEALKLTESVIKDSKNPSKLIRENQARILYILGRLEESEVAYQTYFSGNMDQDDPGMKDFLSVLIELTKFDVGEKVATNYYQNFPSIKTQGWMAFLQYKNANYVESERTYKKILSNDPKNTVAYSGIIDLYIETEEMEKASMSADEWVRLSPENIDAKITKVAVLKAAGKNAEAFDYLKLLSDKHPNDNQLKIELAQMSSTLGLGDHSLITKIIDPVSLSDKLKNELKNSGDMDQSFLEKDAIYRHYLTSVNIEKSGQVRETTRFKCSVLNYNGVEKHAKLAIEFYPTSERIYVNSLKVYDKNGNLTYEGKNKDYYLTDKNKEMATHDKILHIPIKSLAVGSRYEITYTIERRKYNDLLSFKDYWFIKGDPVHVCALDLMGDLTGVNWDSSRDLSMIEDKAEAKIWIEKNIKAFKSESSSPDTQELYTKLSIGSSSHSWADVSRNYYNFVKAKMAPSQKIKDLAQSIIKPGSSKEEQTKAVLQWVQSNITYQAIEFGPRGRMPKASDQTLSTKEGDCKDMSLLLCQLLREVGVEAHLALADTRYGITKKIPDEGQFNHLVVYCPNLSNVMIDPTNSYLDLLKYGPYLSANEYILPVTQKGHKLYRMPVPKLPDVEINIDREISTNMTHVVVKETAELHGLSAAYFRRSLAGKNETQLSQYFTYFFSSSYPQIEITKVTLDTDINDNYTPLKVTIHSQIAKEDTNTKVPMLWESQYYLLSKIIDRRNPLYCELLMTINSTNSFEKSVAFKHAFTSFDNKYSQFSSKMDDAMLIIQTTSKRCEGVAKEYEAKRVQSIKLIPKIILP